MLMAMKLRKFIVVCIWLIQYFGKHTNAVIGVNWGRNSLTNLVPSMVVDLMLQNGIRDVKLYNGDVNVIRAFSGTDIRVTVTIQAVKLITSVDKAREWIKMTMAPFKDVDFRYVSIGSSAFTSAKYSGMSLSNVVNAINYTQQALDDLGYKGKVKAIITHSFFGLVAMNNRIPSTAEFVPEYAEAMVQTLSIFNRTNAPFMFDIFPIGVVGPLLLDMEFAFPDCNKSTLMITDPKNGLRYTNLFDLTYDATIWALKKYGYGDMKVAVGQIGWPTDGYQNASVEAAERFLKGLLPKVSSNQGTPMRPGSPIDIFIHSLADETYNAAILPFNRHWGIYRANGVPKYKIDLMGLGRDIYPTVAKGGNLMPGRWCVFNNDMNDPDKVKTQFDQACKLGDCTSLSPGGSCSMLSYKENISYAFNAFFQTKFQDERACIFGGLGELVIENPSKGGCVFSVGVVHGNQPTVIVGAASAKVTV